MSLKKIALGVFSLAGVGCAQPAPAQSPSVAQNNVPAVVQFIEVKEAAPAVDEVQVAAKERRGFVFLCGERSATNIWRDVLSGKSKGIVKKSYEAETVTVGSYNGRWAVKYGERGAAISQENCAIAPVKFSGKKSADKFLESEFTPEATIMMRCGNEKVVIKGRVNISQAKDGSRTHTTTEVGERPKTQSFGNGSCTLSLR